MRAISKVSSVIAVLATVALTASAANARSVNASRLGGAHNSASTHGAGGAPYAADVVPYPSGHGSRNSSPDFQLIG